MFTTRLRFRAVVDQISASLVKPLHGKTLCVSEQTHLYSSDVGTKGAQDALASAGLHLDNGGLVGLTGRVKTKCRRTKTDLKWCRRIFIGGVCCHFEYTVNDADVATSVSGATNLYPSYGTTKMHMGVQAGAEAVNKGRRTGAQCCRVNFGSTEAARDQAVLNDAQEDAQGGVECRAVPLRKKVAKSFWYRQHPLPHGQTRKDMVDQVRGRLGHTSGLARGAHTSPLAGESDEVVMPAVLAAGTS